MRQYHARASVLALGLVAGLLAMSVPAIGGSAAPDSVVVPVFRDLMIHFLPDSADRYATPGITVEDRGRVAATTVTLPDFSSPYRVWAELTIRPIPKDDRSVFDRYDRAGNIRLALPGQPDIEVVRFMTAYGGRTDHRVDVSGLSPLLKGRRTFRAFIDTWSSPAWKIDFSLHFVPDTTYDNPSWVAPVYYADSFNRQEMPDGVDAPVTIPAGLARVALEYTSTGHCTDGRDEDEFISKANVISVDGVGAVRFHPWRNDCRRFRERNPYCTRWTDGSWSSDYSRSGWCPGVEVLPTEFDLTDRLAAGRHTLRFVIEDMRPKDAEGHYGYWRVSAWLAGWDHPPRLWRN